MNIPSIKDMVRAGVHFGHQTSRKHPSMDEYILSVYNNVHVFDLEKTQEALTLSLDFIKNKVRSGGKILFVSTKKQAQSIVEELAKEVNMPYVTEKWLGGTITNFKVINGLVKKLKTIEEQEKDPNYQNKYTKKERLEFTVAKGKLETVISGIKDMNKIPDVVYLVGSYDEKTALSEARNKKIPIVAICDTNANATLIDYPIPANDDAVKSIQMITKLVAEAVKEGQTEAAKGDNKEEKKEELKEESQDKKEELK